MHTLMVLYPQPTDPDAFRTYYRDTHLPLAATIPGVRASRHSLSLTAVAGDSPYIAVYEADFDSAEHMAEALDSPEGKAAQADVGVFATGGVQILHFPAGG